MGSSGCVCDESNDIIGPTPPPEKIGEDNEKGNNGVEGEDTGNECVVYPIEYAGTIERGRGLIR